MITLSFLIIIWFLKIESSLHSWWILANCRGKMIEILYSLILQIHAKGSLWIHPGNSTTVLLVPESQKPKHDSPFPSFSCYTLIFHILYRQKSLSFLILKVNPKPFTSTSKYHYFYFLLCSLISSVMFHSLRTFEIATWRFSSSFSPPPTFLPVSK